jgi:hypothetical protein
MGAVANIFLGLNCFVYAFNSHNNCFKVGFKRSSIINLTENIKVLYAVVLDTKIKKLLVSGLSSSILYIL